jgi:hypothetical protein
MKLFSNTMCSLMVLCCFIMGPLYGQTLAVSGKVRSDAGEPLAGVTVVVKGTTTGTSTDASGDYSLTVPDNNRTLVFSYIGFVTREVAIGTAATLDVTLAADAKALDEVVVVGYGTQKKVNVTGSISTVDIERRAARQGPGDHPHPGAGHPE